MIPLTHVFQSSQLITMSLNDVPRDVKRMYFGSFPGLTPVPLLSPMPFRRNFIRYHQAIVIIKYLTTPFLRRPACLFIPSIIAQLSGLLLNMIFKLIFLSALVGIASSACFDNGDKEIGGSCYKFVAQKLTFEDARNWCHYQNPVTASYLAYVPNQFTGNFLASYARSAFGSNDGSFWIGLSRKTGGAWSWDAGFPVGYTNFGDQLGQNYVAESIVNAKWNTFGDADKNFFVCGYDPAAPPTFAPQSPRPSVATPTMRVPTQQPTQQPTTQVPTTTEEYDEFCNIGEKHSTFLFAYAADYDLDTFTQMRNIVIQTVTTNRHNYTKLAMVRFDTNGAQENITYFDDVDPFYTALQNNPPNPSVAADSSKPSNAFSIVSSFLAASGRPLESSMVVLLLNRFPAANTDFTSDEYDIITNNNVKIFPIISQTAYSQQFSMSTRSSKTLTSLTANSNSHFVIGTNGYQTVEVFRTLMSTAYLDSLAVTSSFINNYGTNQVTIGKLRVPHSESASYINFTITVSAQAIQNFTINTKGILVTFYQSPTSKVEVDFGPNSFSNTNFYYKTIQLKESNTYQVIFNSMLDMGTVTMVRVWTDSALYHYGSYASLQDPMGGNTLSKVDEYQGAALRMKLMNDCYTSHAAYVLFTDCAGTVSEKYDSSQTIPIDYIFADEGSFPHYPIVPFFCDSTPNNTLSCIPGTESKYDIQFVAGEFTVIRSFQCRPGVGQINPNCKNIDVNGNYYCNRDKLPYMRGPTGQIPDCLVHGHVEYDFNFAEAYVCVCDDGYSGDSCEKH